MVTSAFPHYQRGHNVPANCIGPALLWWFIRQGPLFALAVQERTGRSRPDQAVKRELGTLAFTSVYEAGSDIRLPGFYSRFPPKAESQTETLHRNLV